MPNRILKESICRSDSINALSWFEEVLFYRLIVSCDDFGRFDGRISIIKGTCFPLKDVTNKDIEKSLNKLVVVGLVAHYKVEEKPYLQLLAWEKHQNIRAKKSKYPAFDETCIQMYADVCKCSRNPIQSKSESESESNTYSSEQVATEQMLADVPHLVLNTGEEYAATQADVEEWTRLYPAVDIQQEFAKMRGWCLANPRRCKTEPGIRRFINTWLSKAQDKGYHNVPCAKSDVKNRVNEVDSW